MKRRSLFRFSHSVPLAVVLLLAGCEQAEQAASAPPPPEVGVYTVQAQPLTLTTDLPGRTSAYRVAEVGVGGATEQKVHLSSVAAPQTLATSG